LPIRYPGPHAAARSLRSGHADAVGVLLTETLSYAFTDPAAVLFLQGLAEAGEHAGVSLLLVPALPVGSEAAAVREAVVDGFVVYSMPSDHPGVLAVLERRLPTVVVDEPRQEGMPFVGIDDRAAAAVTPALTTVRQPLLDKGRIAGQLMLGQQEPPPGGEVLLPTELVVRASTAPPPAPATVRKTNEKKGTA